MSGLSSIENAMADFFGMGASIDLAKVEDLVQAIVTIAPAIEKGLVEATPYVEAIVSMIRNGGTPNDADWAALRTRLDAGSAALQQAAEASPATSQTPVVSPVAPVAKDATVQGVAVTSNPTLANQKGTGK